MLTKPYEHVDDDNNIIIITSIEPNNKEALEPEIIYISDEDGDAVLSNSEKEILEPQTEVVANYDSDAEIEINILEGKDIVDANPIPRNDKPCPASKKRKNFEHNGIPQDGHVVLLISEKEILEPQTNVVANYDSDAEIEINILEGKDIVDANPTPRNDKPCPASKKRKNFDHNGIPQDGDVILLNSEKEILEPQTDAVANYDSDAEIEINILEGKDIVDANPIPRNDKPCPASKKRKNFDHNGIPQDGDVVLLNSEKEILEPQTEVVANYDSDAEIEINILEGKDIVDANPTPRNDKPCPASKKRKNFDHNGIPQDGDVVLLNSEKEILEPQADVMANYDSDAEIEINILEGKDIVDANPFPRNDKPCPASKKRKNFDHNGIPQIPPKKKMPSSKSCKLCHQKETFHKPDSTEEWCNETELLKLENLEVPKEESDHPLFFFNDFCIYDKKGHMVSLDSGVLEAGEDLMLQGKAKFVDRNPDNPNGGHPVKDIGPLTQWWVADYDNNEATIGVSTDIADYLMKIPSLEYKRFLQPLQDKVTLTKLVLDTVGTSDHAIKLDYEELVNILSEKTLQEGLCSFSRNILNENAHFILAQIKSFLGDSEDFEKLKCIPCIQEMISLGAIDIISSSSELETSDNSSTEELDDSDDEDIIESYKRSRKRKKPISINYCKVRRKFSNVRKLPRTPMPLQTAPNATPEIREVFQNFPCFEKQLQKNKGLYEEKGCGTCANCLKHDCGECSACMDMEKFGGKGLLTSAICIHRLCVRSTVDIAVVDEITKLKHKSSKIINKKRKIYFPSELICEKSGFKYYNSVTVGEECFYIGDNVLTVPHVSRTSYHVAQILTLFESDSKKIAHVRWYCRSTSTVLGQLGYEKELFATNDCEDIFLDDIVHKIKVNYWPIQDNWHLKGGQDVESPPFDNETFWFRQKYVHWQGRFLDVDYERDFQNVLESSQKGSCQFCQETTEKVSAECPKRKKDGCFKYQGQVYDIGDAIFVPPATYDVPCNKKLQDITMKEKLKRKVDKSIFTEYYRFNKSSIKGCNNKTPDPFQIGVIEDTWIENKDDLKVIIRKIYRPEHIGSVKSDQFDLNHVFWSYDFEVINARQIVGKCFLIPKQLLEDNLENWSKNGPHRFYFESTYSSSTRKVIPVVEDELKIYSERDKDEGQFKYITPLKSLDIFAGCGGLSQGLKEAGLAECKWAIENFEPAAKAFKRNFPESTVFHQDCNSILQDLRNGKFENKAKQKYPQKGEVDLLVGGPPCQGYSMLNIFTESEYSELKKSAVVSYLSFLDYLRPKYFILENVANFFSMKKNVVLKLCIRALINLGYQIDFAVLQAGQFGVAQTRRRAFLIAAAPGQKLPQFPEPEYCFAKSSPSCVIDSMSFDTIARPKNSAPYRTITVKDAISDLPEIVNGATEEVVSYQTDPKSPFQRKMRMDAIGELHPLVHDHICRSLNDLNLARVKHIPQEVGADWRDLPNKEVRLANGAMTKKLDYKFGKNVCPCSNEQKPCKYGKKYSQSNTLIPWYMVHTAEKHNQMAGCFGRLSWNGYFSTTITNPDPGSKQGRVLHPEQHRIVSVRECARSQGFHDSFMFEGDSSERFRQIGNAVPPPMACALGREFVKAVAANEMLKGKDCP